MPPQRSSTARGGRTAPSREPPLTEVITNALKMSANDVLAFIFGENLTDGPTPSAVFSPLESRRTWRSRRDTGGGDHIQERLRGMDRPQCLCVPEDIIVKGMLASIESRERIHVSCPKPAEANPSPYVCTHKQHLSRDRN